MQLLSELLSTPYGLMSAPGPAGPAAPRGGMSKVAEPHLLMSLAAIAITIGMGLFFLRFFLTRIAQDPGDEQRRPD